MLRRSFSVGGFLRRSEEPTRGGQSQRLERGNLEFV
jgi:hypothetical protein